MSGSERIGQGLPARGDHGPPGGPRSGDPHLDEWRAQLALFEGMQEKLAKDERYSGRFVAVRDGRVVDSDPDEFSLAERVGRRHPGEVVLIASSDGDLPQVGLSSPEIRP